MRKSFFASILMALLIVVGCSSDSTTNTGNGGSGSGPSTQLPQNVIDAINAPMSTLTQDVKDALAYMYSEEGLAYDVYLNIYAIQPVNQLQNIANNAEAKHIEAVNQMAIKYDLNMTQFPDTDVPYSISGIGNGVYPVAHVQYLYDLLYDKGIQSEQDALEVGCMVEVVDIEDLNRNIVAAEASAASDVVVVFNYLRNGSYSHYWTFDNGLKSIGVADGCCAVPSALGFSFCHPEYPQR